VHRFLNTTLGGYVRSVNSYSSGAASVLLPHIVGEAGSAPRRLLHKITFGMLTQTATGDLRIFQRQSAKGCRTTRGASGWHCDPAPMRRLCSVCWQC
jgi:hypothetical protein